MTVQECYTLLEGNYEGVIKRLGKDALVERFMLKFADQCGYAGLCEAMDNDDVKSAFAAAHTLKGICLNLDFTKLGDSASALTEALRAEDLEKAKPLFTQVQKDYQQTMDAIERWQKER